MNTFDDYQAAATRVPAALRTNRMRLDLPILGLQEQAGKIGSVFAAGCDSGTLVMSQEQTFELRARLADLLWYMALICKESGISLQSVADCSITQLHARQEGRDLDER